MRGLIWQRNVRQIGQWYVCSVTVPLPLVSVNETTRGKYSIIVNSHVRGLVSRRVIISSIRSSTTGGVVSLNDLVGTMIYLIYINYITSNTTSANRPMSIDNLRLFPLILLITPPLEARQLMTCSHLFYFTSFVSCGYSIKEDCLYCGYWLSQHLLTTSYHSTPTCSCFSTHFHSSKFPCTFDFHINIKDPRQSRYNSWPSLALQSNYTSANYSPTTMRSTTRSSHVITQILSPTHQIEICSAAVASFNDFFLCLLLFWSCHPALSRLPAEVH